MLTNNRQNALTSTIATNIRAYIYVCLSLLSSNGCLICAFVWCCYYVDLFYLAISYYIFQKCILLTRYLRCWNEIVCMLKSVYTVYIWKWERKSEKKWREKDIVAFMGRRQWMRDWGSIAAAIVAIEQRNKKQTNEKTTTEHREENETKTNQRRYFARKRNERFFQYRLMIIWFFSFPFFMDSINWSRCFQLFVFESNEFFIRLAHSLSALLGYIMVALTFISCKTKHTMSLPQKMRHDKNTDRSGV